MAFIYSIVHLCHSQSRGFLAIHSKRIALQDPDTKRPDLYLSGGFGVKSDHLSVILQVTALIGLSQCAFQ